MTEETKKLFQAPWTVDGGLIRDCYDRMLFSTRVCRNMDTKRMSHMPELYDALMEAAVKYCPDAFFANDECRLCPDKKCIGRKWIKLLRKVRDGE